MTYVVVIDDDDAVRVHACDALRAAGWERVFSAGSAAEVSEILLQVPPGSPCVVLLDLVMPDEDTDVLTKSIRTTKAGASIIALSTLQFAKPPDGYDASLTKPLKAVELVEAVASEVMRQVTRDHMIPHVVTVLALRRDNPTPEGVVTGGTGCLVEIERHRFLLTAGHVIEGITNPEHISIVAGHAAPPVDVSQWRRIDGDPSIDIATLEVPASFDPSTISKRFYTPKSWPPRRAEREEVAFFVGFAGIHRIAEPERLKQHSTSFSDFVSSASSRHFLLADEQLERHVREFLGGLKPFGPTGGMSGAPVFVNRDGGLELVGVLYEGGETGRATFFVAHADFVRADGTIDDSLPR